MRRGGLWLLVLALQGGGAWARAGPAPSGREALLTRHVRWLPDPKRSRVGHDAFQADRAALKKVLEAMSPVTRAESERWPRAQPMAFRVNVDNGFTVEWVPTRWPELKSIKALGLLLQSPWKKRFFSVLDEARSLGGIGHEQLRARFADPRVHAALNCAAIGCPALRDEALAAVTLEALLDDGIRRVMADRSRSRNRMRDGRVEVSMVFKWFREEFEQGRQGFDRLEDVFARRAAQFGDDLVAQRQSRERRLPVAFLDDDGSLNALGR
jgi:hypothetical protein